MSLTTKHRFEALDAFRGIFAVLIVLYHFSAYGYFYDIPIVRHADHGVEFFFVLSGFVISSAYLDKIRNTPNFPEFAIRRFGRLWPLHVVTLTALVGLEILKLAAFKLFHITSGQAPFTGSNDLVSLFGNIFLINGLGFFKDFTWNGPSWSISTEIFTYIIFYICAARGRMYIPAAIATIAISGISLWWFDQPAHKLHQIEGFGFLTCIFDFMVGSLTFIAFRSLRNFRSNTWYELAAALLLVPCFVWNLPMMAFTMPVIFAFTLMVFAHQKGAISTFLLTKAPQYIGRVSFSIYLVHYVIIQIIQSAARVLEKKAHIPVFTTINNKEFILLMGSRFASDLLAAALVGSVLFIAYFTYKFVEEPARKAFYNIKVQPTLPRKSQKQAAS